MALITIWVDRNHAKLFQFSRDQLTHHHYEAHAPSHHTHIEDQIDHLKQETHFFKEFVGALTPASELLILGPGLAKHHFQSFLMEHHPDLARKVVGCETVDHPSDAQIVALARKYFSTEKLEPMKDLA